MAFIQFQGRTIAWRLLGPEAAPLVVLAHPLGMSQSVWDDVLPTLLRRYRVLTWDLPGHGGSAPTTDTPTLEALAEELLALVAETGAERFHFVGTSIGGALGQHLLVHHAERLGAVMLTNTGATIGTPENWHDRATRVRSEGLATMAGELAPRWFSTATKNNTALVEGWRAQLARTDDESYARLCDMLASVDMREALKGRPEHDDLYLLGGSDDLSTPPETLRALAEALGEPPLEIVDEVGHVPSVEQPELVAQRLMTWLAPRRDHVGLHGISFDEGLETRRRVLGAEHVERASQNATTLDSPFQQMITRFAWGELWGSQELSVTERSLITLAILASLGRDGELVLHLKTAHRTGVTEAELRQVLMHVATYAGVPAANHAFGLAKQHGWGDQKAAP
ncbi:3-oxoadipate enol-lactonase / 4-carboxymuconolactone decarboxylase [Kushneria avicenniae]|uniref:3-oxoadipate enol-lactonase / 4-carboxymuconolactone decarboxylase n=1 Tax=Kushneria avicenniae TaxID=402385 RepID=A0A1I1JZ66_9GAMM|nr:alpha/beta fold hydrolase [Kushneria avicenniae]SFC53685.1 3-oxoadipate enol-lactonase / 4-carboxymuconolactone decarboxylase [Kushneria avicenniae]